MMGNNNLNTTNITTFPGHGPAHRVLTSRTATPEQVRAARDLLWAEPGDDPQTRRLTDEEITAIRPETYRAIPINTPHLTPDVGIVLHGNVALWLALIGFVVGLAGYGAVRLGGDVMRLTLGWW